MKNYNEQEVVDFLNRKGDVSIRGNNVLVLRGTGAKNDIGNKSKGKIDFLVNHLGYKLEFTTKFN